MRDRFEAGSAHDRGPAIEVPKAAVALATPTFVVVATRVGAEEHSARLQGGSQLPEHTRESLGRHVKERRIREDAVEPIERQIEGMKILFEHLRPRDLA